MWADGTPVGSAQMTAMQWRIWWLASAGKFFGGLIIFMTGVALPLLAKRFDLDAVGYGLVSSVTLFGLFVGATALGGLADRYGRKRMFLIEMVVLTLFLVVVSLAPNLIVLLLALFGIGVALGCDYPTAHLIISESIPSRHRGRMVLGAFSFQAVGAFSGIGISLGVLTVFEDLSAWRWMYAVAILPAFAILVARFFVVESAQWLVKSGNVEHARLSLSRLLKREPVYPTDISLSEHDGKPVTGSTFASFRELIRNKETRRATILASVPWFLQDISTFGVGIFTPLVLSGLFDKTTTQHKGSIAHVVADDIQAAQGAALVDWMLVVGVLLAILLSDRVGRIKLQIFGFIGAAIGLFIGVMAPSFGANNEMIVVLCGLMLFNFMTNLGPNSQTYLIAGEVFPTEHRAVGAGLAASIGKLGAMSTAFVFPIFLASVGREALLSVLVVTSLLGAVVTWLYRIETAGINLEEVDLKELEQTSDPQAL
ncbi:MFS transporter [Flavimaribacter sediminis]|uniref:MFS transporter n=1 Tax=Flavimaribacter sediminis TaxID=2865987 RepID=UPI00215D9127|nr:MFS transporter [Flavimaribacter sediminis]